MKPTKIGIEFSQSELALLEAALFQFADKRMNNLDHRIKARDMINNMKLARLGLLE